MVNGNKLSPYCRSILINKYIGKEAYCSVSKATRYILIKDALNQLALEMIQKHGSIYNYNKDWCKRNGFSGVSNYKNYIAIKNGFKSKYDREKYWAKLRGETLQETFKRNIKRRGFNDRIEYLNFLAKKLGFKNNAEKERKRYWENAKGRIFLKKLKQLEKDKNKKKAEEILEKHLQKLRELREEIKSKK